MHLPKSSAWGFRLAACQPVPPAGVGFKHEHADAIAADAGYDGFFEVHAENYMGAGGMPHRLLERLRRPRAWIGLHASVPRRAC